MSFWTNYKVQEKSGALEFADGSSTASELPPEQGLQVVFRAVTGTIYVTVHDLEVGVEQPHRIGAGHIPGSSPPRRDPQGNLIDPPVPEPSEIHMSGPWIRVPLRVELDAPDGASVATWTTGTPTNEEFSQFEHTVGGAGSPEGDMTCRVINPTNKTASCRLSIGRIRDRVPKQSRDVPTRLLNHAFAVALETLTPAARFVRNKLYVSFGEELRSYFGDSCGAGVLGDHVFDLGSFELTGALQSVTTNVTYGGEVRGKVQEMWKRTDDILQDLPAGHIPAILIAKNNEMRDGWNTRVVDSDPVLHGRLVATSIDVDYDVDFLFIDEIDAGQIENVTVDVYIAFDSKLETADVLVVTPASVTGVLRLAQAFIGGVQSLLQQYLAPAIKDAAPAIGQYLGEALVALVERDHMFWRVTANEDRWHIEYSRKPLDVTPAIRHVRAVAFRPPARISDFKDPFPDTAARLAPIKTIVVLMQENRSFDHLLGYLLQHRGHEYNGLFLDGREKNPAAPPLINDIKMARAPGTRIPVEPHHAYEHVLRQIDGGKMDGFTNDLVDRGDPQLAMTYYTHEEVPAFDQIAADQCVCDSWFCAHPGPTWPNRFATMTGTIPEVDNLDVSDPRLGAFTMRSIFDALTEGGIQWRYFESDLCFARMFDNYRLDNEHVIPFDDPLDGFEAYFDKAPASEERVIFIDPNFVDVPPIKTANDDHPPADITHGQDFVAKIYNKIIKSPCWENTLFIITYDEHGGFYDHVPPPGTAAGPPDLVNSYPLLHPDGKSHLGPRVPTFLISPWVSAGQVCHQIFDHTAILKTILTRFRTKIPEAALPLYGPRVNASPHLGVALNMTGRAERPSPIDPARIRTARRTRKTDPAALRTLSRLALFDERDYRIAIKRALQPKRHEAP
jgi:phospholipase C